MPQQAELQLLTLAGIAHRCHQETERFFQRLAYNPHYCFELFRRAIVERIQRAWELVYNQYSPLVARWIERHPAFATSGEEAQYFVNRAFEKMWAALSPEKFSRFSDLKSLLRYLQMCGHSAILDHVRTTERPTTDVGDEAIAVSHKAEESLVEDQALDQLQRRVFWQKVNERLNNEKERRVVYGTFILALKPREICAQYHDTFHNVQEVYRIKENVMARLRRDDEFQATLGECD
jgi:RNA polymerase sigma factor (sigma-70 family)